MKLLEPVLRQVSSFFCSTQTSYILLNFHLLFIFLAPFISADPVPFNPPSDSFCDQIQRPQVELPSNETCQTLIMVRLAVQPRMLGNQMSVSRRSGCANPNGYRMQVSQANEICGLLKHWVTACPRHTSMEFVLVFLKMPQQRDFGELVFLSVCFHLCGRNYGMCKHPIKDLYKPWK